MIQLKKLINKSRIKTGAMLSLFSALLLLPVFTSGCGSSSDSGGSATLLQGQFLDSAVKGLTWESGGLRGTTTADGKFSYTPGSAVSFYLGGIYLGTAKGGSIITPVTIVPDASDSSNQTVLNITRFLQSLDDDGNPLTGINISSTIIANASEKVFDFRSSGFESRALAMVSSLSNGTKTSLVSEATAKAHLDATIADPTAFNATLAAGLQAIIESYRTTNEVPGVVAAVRMPGGATWTGVAGYSALTSLSNTNAGTAIAKDAKFRVGSITKTFTAMAILQLVDEGKLALTDTLEKWLPSAITGIDGTQITVKMLLNHTSGIESFTNDTAWVVASFQTPLKTYTNADLLTIAGNLRTASVTAGTVAAPGSGFHYSNTAYVLLGMIVEKITSKTLAVNFSERFFTKLGLTNTSFPDTGTTTLPGANNHGYIDWNNFQPALSGFVTVPNGLLDYTNQDPSYVWCSGSVVSTVGDILIWLEAVGSGSLLSASTYAQQMALDVDYNGVLKIGLGIMRDFTFGSDFVGHRGQIPGFDNEMQYKTTEGISLVVMANRTPKKGTLVGLMLKQLSDYITAFGTTTTTTTARTAVTTKAPVVNAKTTTTLGGVLSEY